MGFEYSDDPDDPNWIDQKTATLHKHPALPDYVLKAFPNTGKTRGRPKRVRPKVDLKLRIDPDVVDAFKADGAGWQTRMNAALRKAAGL